MNLENYQSKIKELLLARSDPYYNDLFDKILATETPSDKFLIKMEITRLSKPCQRIIDLRDKSVLECKPFFYKNTQHYLCLHAKDDFEKSIEIYNEYTIGVFEYVSQEHLKRKKQLRDDTSSQKPTAKINQQCRLISLAETNKRSAPRMFFVSDVELEFDNGSKIEAQTTNISTSGLRIKLKSPTQLENKQIITVYFNGFKKEYIDNKALSPSKYQLVGQDALEETQYLYLTYIDNDQNLINFIQSFIRSNQYKYKIDVHYYYQLAKNKLLTHYYLSNSAKLVIALNQASPTPFLFSIENKQNKSLIEYWQFNNINNLYSLFSQSRSLELLSPTQDNIKTTLYSFTYQDKGIKYYFSATEEELITNNMKGLFIHYGCRKKSWRVYNLTATKYQHHHNENIQLTAHNKQLDNITHLVTLEEIKQSPSVSGNISGEDLNTLNKFVHYNHIQANQNTLRLMPNERRQELRHKYKSNITVDFADISYRAKILDLSLSGLKIKLQSTININNGEQITINLKDLQKVSQKFNLSGMQYTLISHNADNVLHLQVADEKTRLLAKTFFTLLLTHNPNHFEVISTLDSQIALINDLSQIQGSGHLSSVFFVKKEKHRFNIKYAALERIDSPLNALFRILNNDRSKNELNTTPITNNNLYRRLISTPLNANKSNQAGTVIESIIYVVVTPKRNNQWRIKSFLDEDFKSVKERNNFIMYSKERSQVYILHYRLTALNRPDFSIIQKEMSVISKFALHLTKKLQEDLQAMCGLIEITDCTKVSKI